MDSKFRRSSRNTFGNVGTGKPTSSTTATIAAAATKNSKLAGGAKILVPKPVNLPSLRREQGANAAGAGVGSGSAITAAAGAPGISSFLQRSRWGYPSSSVAEVDSAATPLRDQAQAHGFLKKEDFPSLRTYGSEMAAAHRQPKLEHFSLQAKKQSGPSVPERRNLEGDGRIQDFHGENQLQKQQQKQQQHHGKGIPPPLVHLPRDSSSNWVDDDRDTGQYPRREEPHRFGRPQSIFADFSADTAFGDLFTGKSLFGKRKKEIDGSPIHDRERQSYEAELERVQRMQEEERRRIAEAQERMIEMARREHEERERLAREEEERRLRMIEEEAREKARRAQEKALEAERKLNEKRAREEEERRFLEAEDKRKEGARRLLLDLERRMAQREAEKKAAQNPSLNETVSTHGNDIDGPAEEEPVSGEKEICTAVLIEEHSCELQDNEEVRQMVSDVALSSSPSMQADADDAFIGIQGELPVCSGEISGNGDRALYHDEVCSQVSDLLWNSDEDPGSPAYVSKHSCPNSCLDECSDIRSLRDERILDLPAEAKATVEDVDEHFPSQGFSVTKSNVDISLQNFTCLSDHDQRTCEEQFTDPDSHYASMKCDGFSQSVDIYDENYDSNAEEQSLGFSGTDFNHILYSVERGIADEDESDECSEVQQMKVQMAEEMTDKKGGDVIFYNNDTSQENPMYLSDYSSSFTYPNIQLNSSEDTTALTVTASSNDNEQIACHFEEENSVEVYHEVHMERDYEHTTDVQDSGAADHDHKSDSQDVDVVAVCGDEVPCLNVEVENNSTKNHSEITIFDRYCTVVSKCMMSQSTVSATNASFDEDTGKEIQMLTLQDEVSYSSSAADMPLKTDSIDLHNFGKSRPSCSTQLPDYSFPKSLGSSTAQLQAPVELKFGSFAPIMVYPAAFNVIHFGTIPAVLYPSPVTTSQPSDANAAISYVFQPCTQQILLSFQDPVPLRQPEVAVEAKFQEQSGKIHAVTSLPDGVKFNRLDKQNGRERPMFKKASVRTRQKERKVMYVPKRDKDVRLFSTQPGTPVAIDSRYKKDNEFCETTFHKDAEVRHRNHNRQGFKGNMERASYSSSRPSSARTSIDINNNGQTVREHYKFKYHRDRQVGQRDSNTGHKVKVETATSYTHMRVQEDCYLQSGVVHVFEQPGIVNTSDEDGFVKVKSKRQILNEKREQKKQSQNAHGPYSRRDRMIIHGNHKSSMEASESTHEKNVPNSNQDVRATNETDNASPEALEATQRKLVSNGEHDSRVIHGKDNSSDQASEASQQHRIKRRFTNKMTVKEKLMWKRRDGNLDNKNAVPKSMIMIKQ